MIPARVAIALASSILSIAVAHAAEPAEIVIANASFGHVEVATADVETALVEGGAAHAAAREVLLLPDARFGITARTPRNSRWVAIAPDGSPVYSWAFRNAASGGKAVPPSHALRHEIGHDLFIRHLVPSSRQDQYGGDAPDWLDEMAAVAFEGAGVTATRRREAARLARSATLIPMDRFLTMTHPEWAADRTSAARPGGAAYRVRLAASADTPRFYAMARALYDYLVDRTGSPAVVAELGAAFRRGERLDAWILARSDRHGVSAYLGDLDADLRGWIQSDSRYVGEATTAAWKGRTAVTTGGE